MKKKKLEQLSPHLFLVGIVAIVAVVALVLHGSGGAEGASVYQRTCKDTDPDNIPTFKGTAQVVYANGEIDVSGTDYCIGGTAFQYDCESQGRIGLAARPVTCPEGLCDDAGEVCLLEPTPVTG